jgi:hypothetical protein
MFEQQKGFVPEFCKFKTPPFSTPDIVLSIAITQLKICQFSTIDNSRAIKIYNKILRQLSKNGPKRGFFNPLQQQWERERKK